ncbi:MAG: hypothetical protein U0841_24795 [Chloroflexia bacterium]
MTRSASLVCPLGAADGLGGPSLDAEMRREVQIRRFRAQAARAARETPYYERLFAEGVEPTRLGYEEIAGLPRTPKGAAGGSGRVRAPWGAADAVQCDDRHDRAADERPFLRYELRTMVSTAAFAFALGGQIGEDVVQINTSSRATLGNLGLAGAAARSGRRSARWG